jgi:hypothetical protein
MVPGVPKHPRFRSRNYLVPFLAFFVSSATGEGAGGMGASGVLSSLRLYWVNCQFSTSR